MEAVTAGAKAAGTGSKTIADLLPLAVERFGDAAAQRFKVGDEWKDVSYAELGEAVKEVALGLVDLGIEPGDKISILAHTRPEWTEACFGILTAGATLVTIYQTNSPEECQYVLHHSDSRAVFVEDGEQLAKIRAVEDDCPELKHVIVMEPGDADLGDALTLDQLRERGRGRDAAEWKARYEAVTPDDMCLYIYTSGTTGPPKGCLLTHANYRAITDAVVQDAVLEQGDSSYLFLPLAHAFAILIQFATFDLGATLAYWSRDPKVIIADIAQVSPTFFPSVPRMFEKIYTLATSNVEDKEQLEKAVKVGVKVRMMRGAGEEVPAELQQGFDQAEEKLFKNVRGLFGQNIRECVTGAAPIAPEILEFFFACGVPVMEGYGMTETSTSATVNRPEPGRFRFGSVGQAQPGVEVKMADDGEVLIKGPNIFQGYYKTEPPNRESGEKRNGWSAEVGGGGGRRPYLVALITLDPEEAPALAQELGLEDADLPSLAKDEKVRALVRKAIDEVNSHVGPVEQIKRFEILDHDLSQETGELTPTLKVKRNVVHEKFADVVERIYETAR